MHFASRNIESPTSNSIKLVKTLRRCKVNIACIQETNWVGAKAREIDEYKLWHSEHTRTRNGVGIVVKKELVDQVVEVKRKCDHLVLIKLVVGVEIINMVCA